MTQQRRILAYAVQEDCESTGGIVFAKGNAAARRLGAQTFGDGDFNWGSARRAPWADAYAPGPVPFKVMFEHGWWQECHGCGRTIREEECDDEGNPIAFDIVEHASGIYCTLDCFAAEHSRRGEEKAIARATIAALTARVLMLMPGAVICGRSHVYVPRGKTEAQQAWVEFTFPGETIAPALMRFDQAGEEPHVTICAGDRAAFHVWRSLGYPPHLMDAAA